MIIILFLLQLDLTVQPSFLWESPKLSDISNHINYLESIAGSSNFSCLVNKKQTTRYGLGVLTSIKKEFDIGIRFSYWNYNIDLNFFRNNDTVIQNYELKHYSVPISLRYFWNRVVYVKTGIPLSYATFHYTSVEPNLDERSYSFWGIGTEFGTGIEIPIRFLRFGFECHYNFHLLRQRNKNANLWFYNTDKYLYIVQQPTIDSRKALLDFSGLGCLIYCGFSF